MKKILLFSVIGLLLVGIAVGATLFLTGALNPAPAGDPAAAMPAAGAAPAAAAPARAPAMPKDPPEYIAMDPPMVVGLDEGGVMRYLQVSVSLMTRNSDLVINIVNNKPRLRNNLLMLFSSQLPSELTGAEAIDRLRMKSLETAQAVMEEEIGQPAVEDVFFTSFVIQ